MNRDQQWVLFGYDTRQVGQHWLAAWRDLLWGNDSPLRQRLDEVVVTERDGVHEVHHAGRELHGDIPLPVDPCRAICLPDDLLLNKALTVPLAAEAELRSVIALEVNANSPFSHGDTAFGWRVSDRTETQLRVNLLIASRSSIMAWLNKQHGIHDAEAREIWGSSDAGMIVLQGFGEARREARYRARLLGAGVRVGMAAALLLLIAGLAGGAKQMELGRLEVLAEATGREAAGAAELRASLAAANQQIQAARDIVANHPNPHVELARLTRLLSDEAFAAHMAVRGDLIRLRGRAMDAAAVMQRLSSEPAYSEVTAPQAIVRVGNTALEQFYLDIRLAGRAES